jgi:SPP1 gp7 family putative phage head morphogenesis protein
MRTRYDAAQKQALAASRMAEQRYVRDLRNIMKQVGAATERALHKHLYPSSQIRHDGKGRISAHTDTVNILGVKVQVHVKAETGKAFDKMAAQVNKQNGQAVRGLVGIPRSGTTVAPVIDQFREQNIQLMAKAGSTYVDQVRDVLEDPENEGLRVEELAKLIGKRAKVNQSKAELIARDQTLKLNAQLTQTRMQGAGVTKYTWSTSRDERVRPMHAELEGQTFSFADPPVTNEAGETNNPGEDIQCRCVPLPIIEDFDDL